ncbi:hypothetical protein [Phyllobacterium zundukense]|uniref:Uncharacterized protein n=1 Tax=Phyllobacterium zundukense TaxID=1867719 RepID=A0ACD4CW46_9HYPH|nr:hypothetical protein [Phyllobacterium zundukense]UXN57779.1 hypothetical protein N8E88_02950 [Phyllobacterium zundukense]
MKNLLLNPLFPVCCILPLYLISVSHARADVWGCQVLLCLSNPGGPTEFAECRPPVEKLWRHLAKGHSFPTCSGVGFHSSRPGYEPYYCDDGYKLVGSYGPHGQEATCVSQSLQEVSGALCSFDRDRGDRGSGVAASPRWQRVNGRFQCMAYPITRPNVRSQPHYVDVTIDGSGTHRVWY